jgi:hypothetical protein
MTENLAPRPHDAADRAGHEPDDVLDDEPPASPAESLRLIDEQRARAGRQFNPDPRLLYWPWGISWLIGFGLLYLRFGPDGLVLIDMPEWLPLGVLFSLQAAALVLTAMIGRRAGRQVAGESTMRGLRYGLSWGLGFAGVSVTLGRISGFLPDDQIGLVWAGVSVTLVSALYVAGSAVWDDPHMFIFGCWMGAINVVGVIAGPGWHSLIIALAGGGGAIVAGLLSWSRLGRLR